jgi:ubiquinol-cytochrome c reductase cytochrome b subunit
VIARIIAWLDSRTRYRRARGALLDEPIPAGTGWLFTLGSVLLALLAVQLLTGAFLTLYYAPTPDHAYDSVRFIDSSPSGRLVRGLHHFGASFLIVFVVLHALRVVIMGSYKAPREVTWISGLVLLGLLLAFALTGYLLPWDQRAYWATVVTINIARLAPLGGDALGALLQGGQTIGAMTLTRWYSVHVIFLPLLLIGLVVLHVVLMRLHGISGPIGTRDGNASPFYPAHAARDVVVVTVVLVALAVMAWRGAPALEPPADPTDATYIPRPEWYFLGLFQLLKYFPGRLEVVGAIVLPGLAALLLTLLPWIDRRPERALRDRLPILVTAAAGLLTVVTLTALGWQDRPRNPTAAGEWSLREIAGGAFVTKAACNRCHTESGVADPLQLSSGSRPPEWVSGHVTDPEMIAPGLRQPPALLHEREAAAILAYVRRLSRGPMPQVAPNTVTAAAVFARHCIGCHVIDGDGGSDGPELSKIGAKHDQPTLRRWIADPESVNPDAEMPSFQKRLTPEELDVIAAYLAHRR